MNRPTLLMLATMLASAPLSFAKSELETLRIRCAEQERQIRDLEEQNSKLRLMNGMAPKYASRSAPATAADAKSPSDGVAPTSKATGTATTTYTVRAGDSWERVARKFGTQPTKLAALNGTKPEAMLLEGQRLKVPTTATAAAEPASKPKSPLPSGMSANPTTYQVKEGETYYSIGKKLGISADSLVAANPSLKPTGLRPGVTIQLTRTAGSANVEPAKSESAKTAAKPVAKAETPKSVAKTETPKTAAKTETPKPLAKSAATSPSSTGSSKVSTAALQTTAATTPGSASQAASPPVTPPPSSPPSPSEAATPVATASNPGIRSITTDGTTTYGEFASKHGTTVDRLNSLNALDLVETTVLAKGSELYVPAQP